MLEPSKVTGPAVAGAKTISAKGLNMGSKPSVSRRQFIQMGATGAAVVAASVPAGAFGSQSVSATDEPSWLGAEPNVDEASVAETVDCEVLVVGAGNAGTFAACHAAEAGAQTLLIEANESGNGPRSSGIGAVGSRYQAAVGAEIDKEDIVNDIVSYALNQCDIELVRAWADHSGEAVDWYGSVMEPAGFAVCQEWGMPSEPTRYPCWPTGHGTAPAYDTTVRVTDSIDLLPVMIARLEEFGGTYCNNTRMVKCIKEGGRVAGVYAEDAQGRTVRINASKGVIIATGGYVNNEEMFSQRCAQEMRTSVVGRNHGTAHGDGIKACLWAGGIIRDIPTTVTFDRAIVKPGTKMGTMFGDPDYVYFVYSTQPFLKVDNHGRRITNESSPYDFIVHAAARQADPAWHVIWDSTWREDVTRFATIGCSTLFLRPGSSHRPMGLDACEAKMESYVEDGYIIKADTLEELAEGLMIDVDTFLATVEQYNSFYAAGKDTQFGKDPFRLSSLDTPPYYGMRSGTSPLCPLDGVLINTSYQALDAQGEPIEGLYVVGNDAGGYFAGSYPNQAAGLAAGRGATAGMLCGRIVASK